MGLLNKRVQPIIFDDRQFNQLTGLSVVTNLSLLNQRAQPVIIDPDQFNQILMAAGITGASPTVSLLNKRAQPILIDNTQFSQLIVALGGIAPTPSIDMPLLNERIQPVILDATQFNYLLTIAGMTGSAVDIPELNKRAQPILLETSQLVSMVTASVPPSTFTFVTAANTGETITPSIVIFPGCPYTPSWDMGEGAPILGLDGTYTYLSDGPHTIIVTIPDIGTWLKDVYISSCEAISINVRNGAALLRIYCDNNSLTILDASYLVSLFEIYCYSNILTTLDIRGCISLDNMDCSDNLLNNINLNLPALRTVWLGDDAAPGYPNLFVNINCALLPSMENLEISETPLQTLLNISSMTILKSLIVINCAMSQARVDAIIYQIYAARAIFTHLTPVLNISGTNAAPSGIYQAMVPPTTGNEAVYDLVNDPASEGFNKWIIVTS